MVNAPKGWQVFDSPAKYRIRVGGRLMASWSERLGGLAVGPAQLEEDSPETVLVGELCDQAALLGVLITLYEMHLPLLLVERLPAVQQE